MPITAWDEGLIVFYQHCYPCFDYAARAERQRERIRKAFEGTAYPYSIISCQFNSEKDTLERLSWDAWKQGARYYAYVHLKGITHPGDQCVADWCEMMEYFMIDCWRTCRQTLEKGFSAVGVNLEMEPWPHYAGNFFWVRAEDVMTLEPMAKIDNPERWIGSSRKQVNMKSLHDSGVHHYKERYPPERYR